MFIFFGQTNLSYIEFALRFSYLKPIVFKCINVNMFSEFKLIENSF